MHAQAKAKRQVKTYDGSGDENSAVDMEAFYANARK